MSASCVFGLCSENGSGTVIESFCSANVLVRHNCLCYPSGRLRGTHGPARFHGGVRGHRGPRGRRAGAGRARPARLQHRRPARQGGLRGQGARARRAGRLGPRAAGAPHHHQSRARRSAEGRQPLRPADRARPDGGDRRGAARRAGRLHRAGRARPRRLDRGGRRRAAGGDRRQLAERRLDLSGGLRTGGGLGQPRDGDRRAVVAHPARQPLQGHAGAVAAEARHPRRSAGRDARSRRHQGPGERQARARGRRRRRPQPADDRPARLRQVDAGGAAADHPADACRRPSCSKCR